MDTELLDFTRRALAAGVARADIERVLNDAGWPPPDITAALGSFAEISFPVPVPRPKPYLSAWEVFIYLVMFVALYATAYNLGALIFEFIDLAFPDLLQYSAPGEGFYSGIRGDIAGLVVSLPVFLFMFGLVNRGIAADLTKRSSRPRKWLTYLTLFIAVVTLLIDGGTLVYNLLGGEFTSRFALKMLTVAIIAGGVFTYFLVDVRKDEIQ